MVAPPSSVSDSCNYILISGDFAFRPIIDFQDIHPLINTFQSTETHHDILLEKISRNAKHLLFGKDSNKYQSRSELEQALIVSCINSGLSFDEVLSLFIHFPLAHKLHLIGYTKIP